MSRRADWPSEKSEKVGKRENVKCIVMHGVNIEKFGNVGNSENFRGTVLEGVYIEKVGNSGNSKNIVTH